MRKQAGFTLIEILVVVVIVSVLTAMGVQMISSGSVERNLKQHAKIMQSSIEYACDQATLQNIIHGVRISTTSYAFVYYVNQQWVDLISQDSLFTKELTDGSQISLEIDGITVVLQDDITELPQIICDNTGQMTSFVLVISDATSQHHYQLRAKDFWQIEGQWLDETQK
jgi:type II secretion system protein H